LTTATRVVHGTSQPFPTHLVVAGAYPAAELCGPNWVERLDRGRNRATALAPFGLPDLAAMVRTVDTMSDADFALLLAAGRWFSEHDGSGLTPRQVPVPGLHAKWLNKRQHLVAVLAGKHALGLLPAHPPRVHFTYLDPEYVATGSRRHDSHTIGDTVTLPYVPRVVLISENKDTTVHFPPVPFGIAVEGEGFGGGTVAALPWIAGSQVFYWGDLDAAGFEILHGFRTAGIAAVSLLMDQPDLERYLSFGTSVDQFGKPLSVPVRRNLPLLTAGERAAYENLTDPCWPGHRRIEQERIPLIDAHLTLLAAMAR
jgi:hypothetical protein